MTVEAVKEFGLSRKDAVAREEHVRAGAAVVDVRPSDRDDDRVPGQAVREGRRHPRRQHRGVQGGLELRGDHRDLRGLLRGQAGPDVGRASTATSAATWRWPTAWWPAACSPASTWCWATYPITPASDILHELSKHKAFGDHDVPGRGRDRRHRRGDRRLVRGQARDHLHLRAGHRAQVRGDRARGDDRAAAAGHRRPARWPVDRAADQDRAGRPAAGDVRPQRRGAGADRRARSRPATASTPPSRRSGSRSPTGPR